MDESNELDFLKGKAGQYCTALAGYIDGKHRRLTRVSWKPTRTKHAGHT